MKQVLFVLFVAVLCFLEIDGNNIIKYASNRVGFDEYYIVTEKYDKGRFELKSIHSTACRKMRNSKASFTGKHKKYEIMIGSDIDYICNHCILKTDVEKMVMCHHYNISDYIDYLKRTGSTKEELKEYLSKYNLNPNIVELYGEDEDPWPDPYE